MRVEEGCSNHEYFILHDFFCQGIFHVLVDHDGYVLACAQPFTLIIIILLRRSDPTDQGFLAAMRRVNSHLISCYLSFPPSLPLLPPRSVPCLFNLPNRYSRFRLFTIRIYWQSNIRGSSNREQSRESGVSPEDYNKHKFGVDYHICSVDFTVTAV